MKVAELFEKHGFQDVAITVKTRHSLDCLVGRTLALWPFKKPSAGEGSCALPCQRCGSVLKIDIGVSGDCGTLPVILSHPAHNHDDKSGRSAEDSLFRGAVGELAGLGDAKPSLAVAHLHDRPLPAHVQQIENPGLRLSLLKKHGLLGLGPAASVVCLYANLDEEEGYLARLLTGSGSAGSVDTSRGTDGSSGDRLQAAVTAATTDVTALLAAGTPLAVFGYSAANKGMSWNKRPAKLLTVLFQETEAEYIKKAERHFMYMQLVKDWDRAPANTAPDAVKAVQAEAAEFIWDALTRKVGPLLDPRDEVVSEIGRQVCMAETTCVTLRLQGQGGPLTVILWLHFPKEGADGACFVLPGIGLQLLVRQQQAVE
ncbi:hypothetical protein HYH03_003426 [Edaphochlamys debaryana]|uniref:Uncharacterized protein n=1 Tax=Edaphochlamys debaryana TaxID=47281 RepID=A0A835YBV4_9CHLO|nr:hypothetical protein HYH03_003426 [Edaphochlamys debaryana]|eukprot:KAG2498682.1 hypothetical protein HYH03_003426 [Edaphochlamys debaryana]